MNRHCYRIIFNRARRMLVVVSELARARGGDTGRGPGCVPECVAALRPLTLALWLAGGMISAAAQAETIAPDRSAPGGGKFGKRMAALDPGVIDQNIDWADIILDMGNRSTHFGRFGHIKRHAPGAVAFIPQRLRRRIGLLLAAIVNEHMRTVLRQPPGQQVANAPRRTGDQRPLPRQIE